MRLVSIGECMIELSGAGENLWRSGFAGDTFNTAWYARATLPAGSVDYVTCVGTDPVSQQMLDFMGAGGIGTDHVMRHPTRVAGLYMITLKDGERSFTYWRDQAAARCLADDPATLTAAVNGADLVYFSGITLGILTADRRAALLEALQGQRIAFDPNLRPRLWPDTETMCEAIMQAARVSEIALPSYEDEADFFGDADPEATLKRYADAGATEIVVKNGGGDMLVLADGQTHLIEPGPKAQPVDTTGAGDSFNGAYFSARLQGIPAPEAARYAHGIAKQVIGHKGALMPMDQIAKDAA
ncbi:sugar kinase [Donghicola sp.]|uniref:sugar kinase n=1 Tax=Donghicola sp. TaxID=1929294 RepID=UPI0025F9C971|nr:sugar kinase [Donghicola sp.]MCT4575891.1 sugar kinase [Donghicola sp.]